MKVDEKTISYEISRYVSKARADNEEKITEKQLAEEQTRADRDTVVNISQASKEVQLIKEVISSQPDVREDKVSDLRKRIESGTYEIDKDAVADKLVNAFIEDILY